jgi:hypothetical protein
VVSTNAKDVAHSISCGLAHGRGVLPTCQGHVTWKYNTQASGGTVKYKVQPDTAERHKI